MTLVLFGEVLRTVKSAIAYPTKLEGGILSLVMIGCHKVYSWLME